MILTRSSLDRGVVCGPVDVLFHSGGKSLKIGQIKLGDMQVFSDILVFHITFSFSLFRDLRRCYLSCYAAAYPQS